MKQKCYIDGFHERVQEAIKRTGLTKGMVAAKAGFDRKTLYPTETYKMMTSGNLAKFCAATGVSADWMLGLSKEMRR